MSPRVSSDDVSRHPRRFKEPEDGARDAPTPDPAAVDAAAPLQDSHEGD